MGDGWADERYTAGGPSRERSVDLLLVVGRVQREMQACFEEPDSRRRLDYVEQRRRLRETVFVGVPAAEQRARRGAVASIGGDCGEKFGILLFTGGHSGGIGGACIEAPMHRVFSDALRTKSNTAFVQPGSSNKSTTASTNARRSKADARSRAESGTCASSRALPKSPASR